MIKNNVVSYHSETVVQGCSVKKVFLEISQISQENSLPSFSIKNKACNFIKRGTLAYEFSCEFCQISKNTFFVKHLWWLLLYHCHDPQKPTEILRGV